MSYIYWSLDIMDFSIGAVGKSLQSSFGPWLGLVVNYLLAKVLLSGENLISDGPIPAIAYSVSWFSTSVTDME